MSPLSRERMQIALSPQQVAMVRFSSRWNKKQVTQRKLLPCAHSDQQPNWGAALASLRELLVLVSPAKIPVSVILSNHFVRYMVLQWSAELVTRAEEAQFARARFIQVFGDRASEWTIRASDAPAGMERLAAAADRALLEAVAATLEAAGLTLESCQPALMAQFNAGRSRIGDTAWLVCAEHGRLLIARVHQGNWRSVRVRPLNEQQVKLRDLLDQERLLLSAGEAGDKVFISAADNVVIDNQGLRPEQLAAGAAGQSRKAPDSYALAMAGLH